MARSDIGEAGRTATATVRHNPYGGTERALGDSSPGANRWGTWYAGDVTGGDREGRDLSLPHHGRSGGKAAAAG